MSENKLHYDVEELEYKVSYHGLHEWYKSMFEKLGWMVLAERDGREHKIMQYKEGVQHLREAIAEKIGETVDIDKKNDLKILHYNVLCLIEHIAKYFGSMPSIERIKRRSMKKTKGKSSSQRSSKK
jgi:hypothetical protein